MAVPKRHTTKGHRNKRRMHIFITPAVLASCPRCKKPVRPHTICLSCGYYKGQEKIDVLKKLTKKERKKKEKEIKGAEKEEKREKTLSMEELSKK